MEIYSFAKHLYFPEQKIVQRDAIATLRHPRLETVWKRGRFKDH